MLIMILTFLYALTELYLPTLISDIVDIGTASLITRTTNDITQIQMVTFMMLRFFLLAPLMCIGGIIMAISKDPGLSWIIVVTSPPFWRPQFD
jgi:hypothetical protein